MRSIALLANEDSGDGSAADVESMLREAGADVTVFDVREPERAAASGAERLAVAGGDGSIGPAADAASRAGVPIAVIPVGTANDFAAIVELPDDLAEACRIAVTGEETRKLELGRASGRPFVNVASIGLSPEAAEEAHGLKDRLGALAYPAGAVKAGATADLELAYTLADGLEYVRAGVAAGLPVDAFAPRLSFFFGIGMHFFMEVAKLRAARLLWSRLMATHFAPSDPRSLALRTHCQTSGWSLSAQDAFNNVARTMIEAMAATQGGTQSLHTNSLDEALALPTDFSARIARNTQLVLALESGTTRTIDPWGGSFFLERLTADLAARAMQHIEEVEALGGMARAIEAGLPQRRIEESAAKVQAAIDSGRQVVVGVNRYATGESAEIEVLKVDNSAVRAEQLAKLQRLRSERDPEAVREALSALHAAARGPGDLVAASVVAARAGATVGEMSAALERVFGRHAAENHYRNRIRKALPNLLRHFGAHDTAVGQRIKGNDVACVLAGLRRDHVSSRRLLLILQGVSAQPLVEWRLAGVEPVKPVLGRDRRRRRIKRLRRA